MYAKIALGNVRKSIRDFSVYFLTLAIGVALFYAFNSITQQTVVLNLSDDSRAIVQLLAGVITGVSVFLAIVLGFLVVYANRFLIRRRKHEFGMYLTLGMTRQDVSKIIVLETLIVGVLALAVGLVAGVFGSQLMTYATARLFDAQIKEFTFVFSAHSCISTIVYFTIMFAVSLLFNVVTISRYKLIDLIDADKVSENIKVRNLAVSVVLFIASLVIIGISYRMLLHNGMRKMDGEFAGATALVSVGTLLFFFSMSGFLLRFVQSRKSFYFRGLNAFTLRQFNSRVNTAWLSISMVCAMLFIAICGFCSGFSLVEAINAQFKAITSVDATLSMTVNHSMDPKSISTMDLNELARSRYPKWDSLVDTSTQVDFYMVKDSRGAVELNFGVFAKHAGVNPSSIYPGYVDDDMVGSLPVPIITASQYNRIRQINGLSPVDFGQDGYLVWTTSNAKVIDFWKKYSQDNKTLDLYGTTYHSVAGGYDDQLRMPGSVSEHSATGTLVVSDNALPKEASPESSVLFVNYAQTKDAGEKTLQDAKKTAFGNGILLGDEDKDEWAVLNLSSTKETAERTSLMTAAVTYLALYIGFILLIACASIFALQQLSEASDNVRAYRVLAELGAERSTANRALFIQIGVYFLLPLIVASAHAFVALSIVADVVSIVGGINIASSLVGTIALVLAVYGGYFLLTYFTARSIIFRGNRRIS
ncbi:MAG: ABC transporter permease [Atopobiaceae bacterium]|nr:ABC transporter permease [Atopobiaceae bacterium]